MSEAKVNVTIGADTKPFGKGISQASADLKRFIAGAVGIRAIMGLVSQAIRLGAEDVDKLRQRSEELGVTLDDHTIQSMHELGNTIDGLKLRFTAWTAAILKNLTAGHTWLSLWSLIKLQISTWNPLTVGKAMATGGIGGLRELWDNYKKDMAGVIDEWSEIDDAFQADAAAAVDSRRRSQQAPADATRSSRAAPRAGADTLARIGGFIGGQGLLRPMDRMVRLQEQGLRIARDQRDLLKRLNERPEDSI